MNPALFKEAGYERLRNQFDPPELLALVAGHETDRAGKRITNGGALSDWLHRSPAVSATLASVGKTSARPVRAILFDKSFETNWSLGWHQDRTISVQRIVDVPGFRPFTTKSGLVHVEPPFAFIERMVTLRFHLDAVDDANAPLLVIPGSHRLGKVATGEVATVVEQGTTVACHADAGDVWACATPILHASKRSMADRRRRVLQVDYSSDDLPGGLEWLGI
jgi:hypothetical protein